MGENWRKRYSCACLSFGPPSYWKGKGCSHISSDSNARRWYLHICPETLESLLISAAEMGGSFFLVFSRCSSPKGFLSRHHKSIWKQDRHLFLLLCLTLSRENVGCFETFSLYLFLRKVLRDEICHFQPQIRHCYLSLQQPATKEELKFPFWAGIKYFSLLIFDHWASFEKFFE